jgi:hypothetical protein
MNLAGKNSWDNEDTMLQMIDFWYVDKASGDIYNAVLCEDEFLVQPFNSGYPDIPIIVGRGDHAMSLEDEYDGLSILHGIDGLWQFECRMYSLLATGLLWYFWPGVLVTSDSGVQPEDLDIGPGVIETAPAGTRVDMIQIDPNIPLATSMQQSVSAMMQQSTFSDILYGTPPDGSHAGYEVSMLGDAARGRIANFAIQLESTIESINRMVLCMVKKWAPDEGVSIFHHDAINETKDMLTLTKEMIGDNLQNKASIKLVVPQDEQAKHAMGMRLAESNTISFDTLRDHFVGIPMPTNEKQKIFDEETEMSDEYRPIRMRESLVRKYGIKEAMPYIMEMGLLPPPPAGFEWTPDGKLALVTAPAAAMPQPGAMPPGAPPPGGAPPGMAPGPMPNMAGPMGGGVPPQMQGLPTPDQLGLTPQEDPALFQEQVGANPLEPEEELRLMEQGNTGR